MIGTAIMWNRRQGVPGSPGAAEALFGWLHTRCDPRTGLWGAPNAEDGDLQIVNGFYRLTRGTYAQFDVAMDASGAFSIGQSGITGLNCNYVGRHQVVDRRLAVQGTLSCSDGKQGTFASTLVQARGTSLEIRMAIQLTGSRALRAVTIRLSDGRQAGITGRCGLCIRSATG